MRSSAQHLVGLHRMRADLRRCAGTDRDVRQGQHRAAEALRFRRQSIAHAVGAQCQVPRLLPHDRPATEAKRENVGHAQVQAYAADVDRRRGLAWKGVEQHADVGRGAPDIDHQRVAQPGQEGGAAQRVGGPAAERQDRIGLGRRERQQRAVVLPQEQLGVAQTRQHEGLAKAANRTPRDAAQRGVQHRGVFALEQPQAADLAGQADARVAAQLVTHPACHEVLLARVDRRENAADRHRIDLAAPRPHRGPHLGLIRLGQHRAVVFVAAAHDAMV